jgi:hypothetical protein
MDINPAPAAQTGPPPTKLDSVPGQDYMQRSLRAVRGGT